MNRHSRTAFFSRPTAVGALSCAGCGKQLAGEKAVDGEWALAGLSRSALGGWVGSVLRGERTPRIVNRTRTIDVSHSNKISCFRFPRVACTRSHLSGRVDRRLGH